MSKALTVVDHKRLAAITTVADAKKVRDEIAALQHYAKVSRQSLKDQNAVACAKFRVERRAGELLLQVPKVQGNRHGETGLVSTIERSGLSPETAYRWMALARIPEAELLAWAALCDADAEELTGRLVYEVLVRQWAARHGAPVSKQEHTPLAPDVLNLPQVQRDLEELELLAPGALVGLSDREQHAIITEVRAAYQFYCEDPARGKVPTWGEEIHAADLRREAPAKQSSAWSWNPSTKKQTPVRGWALDPSWWKRDGGWYPPFTIDRRRLRTLARACIAALKAGVAGYHDVHRRFDLVTRLTRPHAGADAGFPRFKELIAATVALYDAAKRPDMLPLGPWRLSLLWPHGFTVGMIGHRLVIEASDDPFPRDNGVSAPEDLGAAL